MINANFQCLPIQDQVRMYWWKVTPSAWCMAKIHFVLLSNILICSLISKFDEGSRPDQWKNLDGWMGNIIHDMPNCDNMDCLTPCNLLELRKTKQAISAKCPYTTDHSRGWNLPADVPEIENFAFWKRFSQTTSRIPHGTELLLASHPQAWSWNQTK